MSVPIIETFNKQIIQKREEREITSWHISKIGSCMRGMYLERLGVKPDTEFDNRTLRVFSCGHHFEEWFINILKENKEIKIEEQVRVKCEKLGVSGYADFVAEYGEIKKVYEIKSKHSKGFGWLPQRQHQYQLWLYLKVLGIKEGGLIYLSKDDLRIAEYPVLLSDKKLEEEVMAQLNLLNRAWKKKDPSILPLPDEKDWTAKYCRWHKSCIKVG